MGTQSTPGISELIETIKFVKRTVGAYVLGFDCARDGIYYNPFRIGTTDSRQYDRGFHDGMGEAFVWPDVWDGPREAEVLPW